MSPVRAKKYRDPAERRCRPAGTTFASPYGAPATIREPGFIFRRSHERQGNTMKPTAAPAIGTSTPEWLPLLAAAIVQQAIADALDPTVTPAVRREARRFLAGSAAYRFWNRMVEGPVAH